MNVWTRFKNLFSRENSITYAEVISVNATNDTSVVQTEESDPFVVLGSSAPVGGKVLVQNGKILSNATNNPTYSVVI